MIAKAEDVARLAVCAECGGRIYQPRNWATRTFHSYWLHAHDEDWRDNPHDARPEAES